MHTTAHIIKGDVMLLHPARRRTKVVGMGFVSALLLSGCSVEEVVTPPSINAPSLPSIDIDMTKPPREQLAELQVIYCTVRKSPIADAMADEIKAIWNGIVERNRDVPLPAFNPNDPKMCESV